MEVQDLIDDKDAVAKLADQYKEYKRSHGDKDGRAWVLQKLKEHAPLVMQAKASSSSNTLTESSKEPLAYSTDGTSVTPGLIAHAAQGRRDISPAAHGTPEGDMPGWVRAAQLHEALRGSHAVPHLHASAERERLLALAGALARQHVGLGMDAKLLPEACLRASTGDAHAAVKDQGSGSLQAAVAQLTSAQSTLQHLLQEQSKSLQHQQAVLEELQGAAASGSVGTPNGTEAAGLRRSQQEAEKLGARAAAQGSWLLALANGEPKQAAVGSGVVRHQGGAAGGAAGPRKGKGRKEHLRSALRQLLDGLQQQHAPGQLVGQDPPQERPSALPPVLPPPVGSYSQSSSRAPPELPPPHQPVPHLQPQQGPQPGALRPGPSSSAMQGGRRRRPGWDDSTTPPPEPRRRQHVTTMSGSANRVVSAPAASSQHPHPGVLNQRHSNTNFNVRQLTPPLQPPQHGPPGSFPSTAPNHHALPPTFPPTQSPPSSPALRAYWHPSPHHGMLHSPPLSSGSPPLHAGISSHQDPPSWPPPLPTSHHRGDALGAERPRSRSPSQRGRWSVASGDPMGGVVGVVELQKLQQIEDRLSHLMDQMESRLDVAGEQRWAGRRGERVSDCGLARRRAGREDQARSRDGDGGETRGSKPSNSSSSSSSSSGGDSGADDADASGASKEEGGQRGGSRAGQGLRGEGSERGERGDGAGRGGSGGGEGGAAGRLAGGGAALVDAMEALRRMERQEEEIWARWFAAPSQQHDQPPNTTASGGPSGLAQARPPVKTPDAAPHAPSASSPSVQAAAAVAPAPSAGGLSSQSSAAQLPSEDVALAAAAWLRTSGMPLAAPHPPTPTSTAAPTFIHIPTAPSQPSPSSPPPPPSPPPPLSARRQPAAAPPWAGGGVSMADMVRIVDEVTERLIEDLVSSHVQELDKICTTVTEQMLRSEFADPPSWQSTRKVVQTGLVVRGNFDVLSSGDL